MTRSFDHIEDEMLVLAAQAGDAGAFEAILRRWLPLMRRHAARLTGEAAAAEDVAQEACLALVGAIGRLHDPALARAWTLRIVTHKAADWIRRRQRDRAVAWEMRNREPSATGSDSKEQKRGAEQHERDAMVRAACMQLPTGLRALVSLYYGEGMSVAVIAESLGVPTGTVKSRLHEARGQIRAFLERSST